MYKEVIQTEKDYINDLKIILDVRNCICKL